MQQKTSVILPLSAPAEVLLKEAYELQDLIQIGMDQINKLQTRIDTIKEELLTHGVKEAGNYELFAKVRTVRAVNVERFAEKYPEEYDRIKEDEIRRAKQNAGKVVRVQDAERLLGKEQIDPVCDLKSTITHVILKKELDGVD